MESVWCITEAEIKHSMNISLFCTTVVFFQIIHFQDFITSQQIFASLS